MTEAKRLRALLAEARSLYGCSGACLFECVWERIDAALAEPVAADPKLTVREACRRRMPIDGTDAQALEHALTITERERDETQATVERRVKEVVDARFLAMTLYSAAGGEVFVASLPHMMVEQIRQVRRRERDLAYQRGAEAMREKAARFLADASKSTPAPALVLINAHDYAKAIRALPLPEEKQ